MKKKIFNILSLVLCIALGVTFVSVCSSAAGNNKVYAETVICNPGEEISIPVAISNNSGFMGISLIFSYDSSALTPVSVTKGEIIESGLFDDSIGTSDKNEFKVIWCGTDNITADGEVCVLKFKTSDKANGEYKIKVSYESKNTFDKDYKTVKMNCKDITVNIGNGQEPVKQTVWQKIGSWFRKIFNWFIGLFTK